MQKYSTSSRASDTDERVGGFCESGNMSEDRGQGWGYDRRQIDSTFAAESCRLF